MTSHCINSRCCDRQECDPDACENFVPPLNEAEPCQ